MKIIYSHPGKLLKDHLEEVAQTCKLTMSKRVWLQNSPFSQKIMTDVAYLCGAFHDIGKGTIYFDYYLSTNGEKTNGPKNHALISSLFVRLVVKEYLQRTDLQEFEINLLSTFAYTAVRRHHGGLNDLKEEVLLKDELVDELTKIIEAFFVEEIQEIINYFLADLNMSFNFSIFRNHIKSKEYVIEIYDFFDDEIKDSDDFSELELATKIQYFYLHQLLYSTLLLSDKTDVIVGKELLKSNHLTNDVLGKYRLKNGFDKPKSDLDKSKNKAYEDSITNLVKVFNPNQRIYSVTLPTGLGKTLTSFGVALKLRDICPSLHRLIITIPFTSIIDQNFEVYRNVVNTDDSSVILKHHHQAEPKYKIGKDELKPDVSQFLIETWQSEIVVTTFVQLLDSIFSNDKGLLMKLPNLANSIIILDEVQTISYVHWQLINQVFQELGRLLNCYFILMSATQPLIFLPDKEIVEIVPDYKSYFKLFNRTKIINKSTQTITLNDFVSEVLDYVENNSDKDILIILNTKKSCLNVFEKISRLIDSESCELYYMTTLITPFERKRIINILKSKNQGKQRIVVSTALIEAGVDISVNAVFRILAPIDAIIQAAGRANRYDEKGEISDVFIYDIEESSRDSKMVYGADLIKKTQNVLKNITEIEESSYLSLIESYFNEVKTHSDSRINKDLEHIERFEFASLGEFSLIAEKATESLFVQINEDAKWIWDEYCKIYSDEKTLIFEKRLAFGYLKSKFYDYVVNVPIPRTGGGKEIAFDSPPVLGFRLVMLENGSDFYKYSESKFLENTGYNELTNIFS